MFAIIFDNNLWKRCFDENLQNIENEGHEENVEFANLVKNFPTRIWSKKSASIQPSTSCVLWQKMYFQDTQIRMFEKYMF